MISKILNIVLFILIFANSSFAEKDTLAPFFDKSDVEIRKIDENSLNKYRDNEEFNYFRNYQNPETIWDYIKYLFQRFIDFIFGNRNPIGIAIQYIFIIGFIVAVILFLVKSKFRLLFFKNKAVNDDILISEISEDINKIDIEELISKAKSDRNWRLATRYYYLSLLKSLSNNELIKWEINKTNRDYIYELNESNFYEEFKNLSKIYNYIWYGSFLIKEPDFIEISVKFDSVLQKINNKNSNINE